MITISIGLFGLAFLIVTLLCAKRARSSRRRIFQWGQILSASLLAFALTVGLGPRVITQLYGFRPVPDASRQLLFLGVEHIRDVRRKPEPIVVNVIIIDLDAKGVQFLVTSPSPYQQYQLRAQTVSQFLVANHLQVAINGDFFQPWQDMTPLDSYPRSGDPINVFGVASSRGKVYSQGKPFNHPTLYLSEGNIASFEKPSDSIYNAISGNVIFVKDSRPFQTGLSDPYHQNSHPRTAIAVDKSGRKLILIIVDGRQPNYSIGVTMPELAAIAIEYGAYTALNLDGGGSTTLVMAKNDGMPLLLNSPIHSYIPYRERPVANHLGVYALPLQP